MNFAVHTQGLRKLFGDKVAVKNLSLSVNRGEIFGFLGPNGAGKSTSIKMLLGLVKPTAGEALIFGSPPSNIEIRRKVGFLPEDFRFYDWMTPAELLNLHGRLCGVSHTELAKRVPRLIEMVGLAAHSQKRLKAFSKGMLQRIGLAQALVHEPELIFLDEPTSGLDPMGRRLVRDIIRAQKERGATVFLNSHLLSEIEVTCDRVCFIREGEVVASHDLRTFSQGEIRVVTRGRNLGNGASQSIREWASSAEFDSDRLTFTVRSHEHLPLVLRQLVNCGAELYEFTPRRISLEDLFLQIMGEDRGL